MTPIREDHAGQRQLKFKVGRHPLHLFKNRGESTQTVWLKVLAYAFYRDRAELVFDPKTHFKIQPSLAELDLTGEVRTWVQLGVPQPSELEYILRHSDAGEVCLVVEAAAEDSLDDELEVLKARIKKNVHYKYTTKKLKLLMFQPLEAWFDPDEVDAHPAHHVFYSF